MKKIFMIVTCAALLVTGCGQNQSAETIDPAEQTTSAEPDTVSPENTETDPSNEESSDIDSREPETVALVMNQTNGNEKISITMTGLCQYDSLESDAYTDTPADGNVYLVMFLQIDNHDNGDDYFNPENMSASVDSKSVSHVGLFNQPESYDPVFDHVSKDEHLTGYVAWEVPSGWQSFDMEYDGWQDTCSLTVTAHVTPDMLTMPPSVE